MSQPSTTTSVSTEPVELDMSQYEGLSLEALVLLLNTERLAKIKDTTKKELDELRKRQSDVKKLHEAMRAINSATDDKGKLDFTSDAELQQHIQNARDLGVDIKEDKTSYSKDERDRLVENIRIAVDDLNIDNDLQIQTISRLTNERYESYQMARSILKPLSDAKQRMAREVSSGRG